MLSTIVLMLGILGLQSAQSGCSSVTTLERSPAMAKAKREREVDLDRNFDERVTRASVRASLRSVDWPGVDREIERLRDADPCVGKKQRLKLKPESTESESECRKFETLVGEGSPSGKCCVLNPLSKEVLLQAREESFESKNPINAEHLTKVLRRHNSRNAFSNAVLSRKAKEGTIRIAAHNINRGLEFENLRRYYHSCPEALSLSKVALDPVKDADKIAEICAASETDILILNEADRGICRSDFREVTEDLALSLNMNFVSAVEFIELGDKLIGNKNDQRMCKKDGFEVHRMRNEHENAILSRYPIEFVQKVELETCNNWFYDSKQTRRGNRMALIAKIKLPARIGQEVEMDEMLVVSAHLENKTSADCRARQIRQILTAIDSYETSVQRTFPVVMGGDFNPTIGSVGPLRDEWESFGYDSRGNRGSTFILGQRLDYLITRAPKDGSRIADCFHSVWDLTPTTSRLDSFSDHKPIFIDVPLRCK